MNNMNIEEIKRKNNIIEVVKRLGVELKRTSSGYMGLCPFHDDKNPSLSVNEEKQVFHCFGCGKSGDVIKFVEYYKNIDFKEALNYLSDGSLYLYENKKKEKSKVKQLSYEEITKLAEEYHNNIFKNKVAINYLISRGIGEEEIIKYFKIGFNKGYVTFPFFNENNFAGEIYSRSVNDFVKLKHKYLPGEHHGIFNLEQVKKNNEIYLCECVIDSVSLYKIGIKNTTCTFGKANITEELLNTLSKYTNKIYLVYDNDGGNDSSAVKTAKLLNKKNMDVLRIILPAGIKDVNEFLVKSLKQNTEIPLIKYNFNKLEKVSYNFPDDEDEFLKTKKNFYLVKDENNIMIFNINNKEYKVKALKRFAQADLNVVIKVCFENKEVLSKVDLLSEKSREKFARQIKDNFAVSEYDVLGELNSLMLYLNDLQEKEYLKKIKELNDGFKSEPYEISEERKLQAIKNLKEKDYLTETLVEDLEYMKITGEDENKILYSLAIISRMDNEPLHVLIIARSGIGKSYIQKMILNLFPSEDYLRISSATKQVLYYMPKDGLRGKAISIDETSGIQQDAFYSFRTLMSEGKLELLTTEKDYRGINKANRKTVDGPASILLSTTNISTVDNETRSRMIITYGDESEEQTKRIMQAKFFLNNTEEGLKRKLETESILQKHRDMMYMLRETKDVFFVYENKESEEKIILENKYIQSRRNISIYTTLIRTIARTRYFKREVEIRDGKKICPIKEEDILLGEKIMKKIVTNQLRDLKGSLKNFYELIIKYIDERRKTIPRNEYNFTRRDIRLYTSWGNTQTKEYLKQLLKLEYIYIVKSKQGTSTIYRLKDN